MKKISLLLVIALLFCFILTSCAKIISKESIEVVAIVTEKDYDAAYTSTRMVMAGKVMVPQVISHPADYDICFEYDGLKGEWDVDKDTYEQYEVGDTIKCNLITREYDDGTIKRELKVIENN